MFTLYFFIAGTKFVFHTFIFQVNGYNKSQNIISAFQKGNSYQSADSLLITFQLSDVISAKC